MPEITKTISITSQEEKKRLDVVLSEIFPKISRTQWQERIRKGIVKVNQKSVKSSYFVKQNDKVTFTFYVKEEPAVNTNFSILFEDEYLLAIDKPANLPVHPSGRYKNHTLNYLLKQKFGDHFYCHPIHRLDRETSGIILYGKSPTIIKKMRTLFNTNQVQKYYYTIVFNDFPHSLTKKGFIGKHLSSTIFMKHQFIPEEELSKFLQSYLHNYQNHHDIFYIYIKDQAIPFKYSKTEFIPILKKTISHPIYSKITLLKTKLFTGRTHQIRATLYDSGFPIVGDKIYGPDEQLFLKFLHDELTLKDQEILILNRCALHCFRMEFIHPYTKSLIQIQSDMPKDFCSLLDFSYI